MTCFIKKVNNELSDGSKNIFQEAKKFKGRNLQKNWSLKKKIQSLKKVLEKQ